MDLVITSQKDKQHTVYAFVDRTFNNVSSSRTQSSVLREEFVNIQNSIFQQPANLNEPGSININMTNTIIGIQY
jgi:hypothetical protein